MTSLNSSKTTIQPEVGLERADRFIHHVQREYLLVQVLRYCQTTNSRQSYGVSPNLLKDLEVVRPNQVWAADLTSIRMPRQFVY